MCRSGEPSARRAAHPNPQRKLGAGSGQARPRRLAALALLVLAARRLPRARTCWAPRSSRPGSRARSASWASARRCSRRCRPRRATCLACRSGSRPRRAPTSTRCSWRGRILCWRRLMEISMPAFPTSAAARGARARRGPRAPPRREKGRRGGPPRPPRDCDAFSSPSRGPHWLEPVLASWLRKGWKAGRLEGVWRLGDGHEVLDVPRLGQPARRCYPDHGPASSTRRRSAAIISSPSFSDSIYCSRCLYACRRRRCTAPLLLAGTSAMLFCGG